MPTSRPSSSKMPSLLVIFLLVLTSMALIPGPGPALAQGPDPDWGEVKDINDREDLYLDDRGNAYGYLDKEVFLLSSGDRLYAAWETTERNQGGSMIYIRSLKDGGGWGSIKAIGGKEDGVIDTDPTLARYEGDTYLVWQRAKSPESDIMCKVLNEGEWTDCGEVSEEDDYGLDSDPVLAVYKGNLWAAWVTRSPVTGKDPGNGDVVIRSYNGVAWSDVITVLNPTPANGMDVTPALTVYRDKLVAAWITRDDDISNGTDMDLVFREFDGTTWSQAREVTAFDAANDDDSHPTMVVFNDILYFIWQSDGDRAEETDIHYATYDGHKVSSETIIVPVDNQAADENPVAAVMEDRMYVAWNSNDPYFTDGLDDDIAIAVFDGEDWSGPEEVTPKDMAGADHDDHHAHTTAAQDRFPAIAVHDGVLYLAWEQDDQRSSVIDPGDIKYRRHPPEDDGTDLVLTALGLLVALAVLIAMLFWILGPPRSDKLQRYEGTSEQRSMAHKAAVSRAGKGRGRRKGRNKRKGKGKRR